MRALRERGRNTVDEALIFKTVEAQRALVAEAITRTKLARWKAFHNAFVSDGRPPIPLVRKVMMGSAGGMSCRLNAPV